ncbi:MAG: HEAT repeat domain-containing protein [Pirellulales bacterium]
MMHRDTTSFWLMAAWLAAAAGCQSFSHPQMWPFSESDRTTYHTPAMRVDAVRQFAQRSTHVDSLEQQKLTDQLARQIQIEPDPLVRLAVVETIAEFRTPLSQEVLEAGLSDDDEAVRIACCQALGGRGDAASVPKLAAMLRSDQDMDVRLAATAALGKIKSPESMQALVAALDDRDPAMQYVGVQSMKSVTGKDYGPNVEAWRQVATGGTSLPPEVPSIARRIRDMSPL